MNTGALILTIIIGSLYACVLASKARDRELEKKKKKTIDFNGQKLSEPTSFEIKKSGLNF